MHYTEYDTRVAVYALIVDDAERLLLTWWNGEGRAEPAWSLPGGGVDLEESLEEALVREVHEETGLSVELGVPLFTDAGVGQPDPRTGRPFKRVRVVYDAVVTGGTLGTVEVGGSTDYAAWVPLADVAAQPRRVMLVDRAVAHLARSAGSAGPAAR